VSLLREAAERWPDIEIAVPHEMAVQLKDPDLLTHIIDTGISADAMNAQIELTVDAASIDVGFHIPWLIPIVIAGDEARQVWNGKARLLHAWQRFKRRLKRSLGANLLAQGVAVAVGEPTIQLLSIPIRLIWGRFDTATNAVQLIDARRRRINAIKQALESGADGRIRAKSLARISLVLSPNRAGTTSSCQRVGEGASLADAKTSEHH